MKDNGLFIVLSGCSGVGKGTVQKVVMEKLPNLKFSVSATTRKPRQGEVDGVNYYFLSKDDFEKKLKNDEFLEHVKLFDNYYGTLYSEIDRNISQGNDMLLEIDTEGAMNVKKKRPEAVLIFILPPSVDCLCKRLVGRGTETAESIKLREAKIKDELKIAEKYDYVVVNDVVETCANEIINIIKAEKLKTTRNKNKLKLIRGDETKC